MSADKERLLTEAQDALSTPDNVYGMFSNADLEFEDAIDSEGQRHSLTQGTFIKCLESDDRVLRQSAYENLYKAYGAYNNTLSATLAGEVKKNVLTLEHITIKQQEKQR